MRIGGATAGGDMRGRGTLVRRLLVALALAFVGCAALQMPLYPSMQPLDPLPALGFVLGIDSIYSLYNLGVCLAVTVPFVLMRLYQRPGFSRWFLVLVVIWAALWTMGKLWGPDPAPVPLLIVLSFAGSCVFFYMVVRVANNVLMWLRGDQGRHAGRHAASETASSANGGSHTRDGNHRAASHVAVATSWHAKVAAFIRAHTFVVFFVVLLVCWLPWLIALYPGVISPNDTHDQLMQFFGQQSTTSKLAGTLVDGVYINNHHPVLHTVLLGSFVQAGLAVGSATVGLFCFALMQMLALIASLAYALRMVVRNGAHMGVVLVVLAVVSLVPMFPIVACCVAKDVLFTAVAVVLFCQIYQLFKQPNPSTRLQVATALCALLLCLLRSIGVYILVLVLLVGLVLAIRRKNVTKLWGMASGTVVAILVINLLYPALGIAPGFKGEMLAVPYQQTALCLIEHGDELSDQQMESISTVLDPNCVDRYQVGIADPVKFSSRGDASGREILSFLRTWAGLLVQYPDTCIRSWLGLTSSYFCPEVYTAQHPVLWLVSTGYVNGNTGHVVAETYKLMRIGTPIFAGGLPTAQRVQITQDLNAQASTPWGFLFNMAMYVWLALFACAAALGSRDRAVVLPAVFLLLMVAVLVVSPAAVMPRYVYPVFFLGMLMVALLTSSPARARDGHGSSGLHVGAFRGRAAKRSSVELDAQPAAVRSIPADVASADAPLPSGARTPHHRRTS